MTITWNRPGTNGRIGGIVGPLSATVAPAAADPAVEQQWQQVGDLITRFYGYLRDNVDAHPGLAAAIQPLGTAVADYRSRASVDPYAAIRSVLAVVQQQRQSDASIPQP